MKGVLAAISLTMMGALGGCSDESTAPGTVDADSDADADTDGDTDSDTDSGTSTDPDADNDGDGLTNGQEAEIGTNPNAIDTDGDGYSDFLEWVAGTDPLDPGSNPKASGDYVFVSPYSWLPSPELAILAFTTGDAAMDLSTSLSDDGADGEDATALIERISPNVEGGALDPTNPDLICAAGLATADDDGDSVPDRFVGVPPGTTACFEIVPATNETIPPSSAPTIFKAFLDLVGDGTATLDTHTIYFFIPN
jgi:hypothetical protein